MRRLLAITAILVAGAAIYLIARGGGSADGVGDRAVATGDRGHGGSNSSRPHRRRSERVGGTVTPPARSKRRRSRSKAPTARARRHPAPAARKPLTRKQFISQADAICSDAHERVGGIGRRLLKIGVAAAKEKVPPDSYYTRSAALTLASQRISQHAIDDLEALPGPSDPRVDEYLAISTTEARLLGDQAEALKQHDGHTVQTINVRLLKLSRSSRTLAKSYGFHVCGGVGG